MSLWSEVRYLNWLNWYDTKLYKRWFVTIRHNIRDYEANLLAKILNQFIQKQFTTN